MKLLDGKWLTKSECINQYRRLIYKIIRPQIYRSNHIGMTEDDLYQTAVIGLIKAYDEYDPAYETKFMTIAYWKVFGEVMDFVRDHGYLIRFPGHIVEVAQKINKLALIDEEPKIIAELLNKSIYQVEMALKSLQSTITLDSQGDETLQLHHRFGRPEDLSHLFVEEFLQILSPEDLEIVRYRLSGMTNVKIAAIKGVSRQSVSGYLRRIKNQFLEFEAG